MGNKRKNLANLKKDLTISSTAHANQSKQWLLVTILGIPLLEKLTNLQGNECDGVLSISTHNQSEMGLEKEFAVEIFNSLDVNKDGKVSLDEFIQGFKEMIPSEDAPQKQSPIKSKDIDRARSAFRQKSSSNTDARSTNRRRSSCRIYGFSDSFQEELDAINDQCDNLVSHISTELQDSPCTLPMFEKMLYMMVKHTKQLKKESQQLETILTTMNARHLQELYDMESEMNSSIKALEVMREKEKIEHETAKRLDTIRLEALADAYSQLEEKYTKVLKDKNEVERELKAQISELGTENTNLKKNILEAQSSVLLLREEMSKMQEMLKSQQREAERERLNVVQYNEDIESFSEQLITLQTANRRLQESSNELRTALIRNRAYMRSYHQHHAFANTKQMGYNDSSEIMEFDETDSGRFSLISSPSENLSIANTNLDDIQDLVQPSDSVSSVSIGSQINQLSKSNTDFSTTKSPSKFEKQSNISLQTILRKDSVFKKTENPKLQSKVEDEEFEHIEISEAFATALPVEVLERTYRVAMAGDASVGKSSFVLHLCTGAFPKSTSATLGFDFYTKKIMRSNKQINLQLWDTAGQERFRSVVKSYFRRADGVILLYDCTCQESFLNVREWMQAIEQTVSHSIPIIICANKTDLPESAQCVSSSNGSKLAASYGCVFIEISARSGTNIEIVADKMSSMLWDSEEKEIIEGISLASSNSKAKNKLFCCS